MNTGLTSSVLFRVIAGVGFLIFLMIIFGGAAR